MVTPVLPSALVHQCQVHTNQHSLGGVYVPPLAIAAIHFQVEVICIRTYNAVQIA